LTGVASFAPAVSLPGVPAVSNAYCDTRPTYVKPLVSVAVCDAGVVTTTSTGPAKCAGESAVSEVELLNVTDGEAVPPKVTVVPDTKFDPLIETDDPPAVGPLVGL